MTTFTRARTVRLAAVAGVLALLFGTGVDVSAQASTTQATTGVVVSGPCAGLITKTVNPLRWKFDCTGRLAVQGTWTGVGRYHSKGLLNIVTGDAKGTVDEELFVRTGGQSGHIHLYGPLTLDGKTGYAIVHSSITGGAQSFAHASGSVDSDGYMPIDTGVGDWVYDGTWTH